MSCVSEYNGEASMIAILQLELLCTKMCHMRQCELKAALEGQKDIGSTGQNKISLDMKNKAISEVFAFQLDFKRIVDFKQERLEGIHHILEKMAQHIL